MNSPANASTGFAETQKMPNPTMEMPNTDNKSASAV